jgi:hypothetical protein
MKYLINLFKTIQKEPEDNKSCETNSEMHCSFLKMQFDIQFFKMS